METWQEWRNAYERERRRQAVAVGVIVAGLLGLVLMATLLAAMMAGWLPIGG